MLFFQLQKICSIENKIIPNSINSLIYKMSYTPFELIVFNVGQGDCLLLKLPNNKYGLIDFHYDEFINGKDRSKKTIPPSLTYLKQQKDSGESLTIAFVHLSHYHSDHIRGIQLLDNFLIENDIDLEELWLPLGFDILDVESRIDNPKYQSFKAKLNKQYPNKYNELRTSMKSIREIWDILSDGKRKKLSGIANQYDKNPLNIYSLAPDPDDVIKNGEDVMFEFLERYVLPRNNDTSVNTADRNLLSSILKISNGKIRVILGGDACKATWEKVLKKIPKHKFDENNGSEMNYESRLIKVSHHGASNASFIAKWESILESHPELHFIFSAGIHGKYRHPHDKTFTDIESVSLQKKAKALHYSTNGYKDSKSASITKIDWSIMNQDLALKNRIQRKMIKSLEEDRILNKTFIKDTTLTEDSYYDGTHRISDPNLIGFRFKIGDDIIAERMEIN
jgi:beta-lactamase superfamily II metal-dependent hydrolase